MPLALTFVSWGVDVVAPASALGPASAVDADLEDAAGAGVATGSAWAVTVALTGLSLEAGEVFSAGAEAEAEAEAEAGAGEAAAGVVGADAEAEAGAGEAAAGVVGADAAAAEPATAAAGAAAAATGAGGGRGCGLAFVVAVAVAIVLLLFTLSTHQTVQASSNPKAGGGHSTDNTHKDRSRDCGDHDFEDEQQPEDEAS